MEASGLFTGMSEGSGDTAGAPIQRWVGQWRRPRKLWQQKIAYVRVFPTIFLACYLPDRRLSAEQRDTPFQEFKRFGRNQKSPTITLGCFSRERESCKFMLDIREIINPAGWTTLLSGANGGLRFPQHRATSDMCA
jgi:hypothetical protein